MAFQFWNINSFYFLRYHSIKQQKMHLSSALSIFCNDSLFPDQIKIEEKYQLYEEDEHSVVYLDYYPWGLYECVSASTFDHSMRTIHLVGKSQDTYYSPALWVCDRDHSISLSGTAQISGKIFLPKNGINYTQLNFDSYRGQIISSDFIHTSNKELPPIDSTYIKLMEGLKTPPLSLSDKIPTHYHSFSNDPIYALVPENDEDLYAKGRLILYGDKVRISSSWKMSDILLVARHVTVESGFSGALQIIASDTVVIEKGAYLHSPSGVYLHGNSDKTYLHVCADSRLEGYAVVEGDVDGSEGFIVDIHYRQDRGSILSGLLYVNGIAHLEGIISGAAYLKECYYLSGENMYSGLIYDGKIIRGDNLAFPIFFKKSKFNRKIIKKIE